MSDWPVFRVAEVAVKKGLSGGPFGSSLGSKDYVVSGVPVIRGTNLGSNDKFDSKDFVFVTQRKVEQELARNTAIPGDVVFTQRGTLGQVGIVPASPYGEYVISQSQMRLRVDIKMAIPEFIYYQFKLPSLVADIHNRAITTGVPHINLGILADLRIVLPSLPVQEAIAAVLGALDDKIAANDAVASAALALGDAYFTTARQSVSRRATLADLAADKTLVFGDGYRTKRSEHGKPGLPILRVAEVKNGRIEPEFADFVADRYRSAMGGKVSQADDVILTSKGTVGRTAIITAMDPTFVYSPQLCYFRVLTGSRMPSSYIYFWLRSSDFWQQAETRKSQTDMADYLSLTDIRQLTIPVPNSGSSPDWPQTLSSLLTQVSACYEQIRALAELRDALLPKLMSGEIRVQDAEKAVEDVT
jgi:type I restriction enzyme S subunit